MRRRQRPALSRLIHARHGIMILSRCRREPGRGDVARVIFTQNIQRHVACPPCEVSGSTLRDVLDAVFAANAKARSYVLDERGSVRKHMIVFVNGQMITDRDGLSDPVPPDAEVYVMQALSGG
jgi:molybdopterin synthase sulfur carrier subunit